jgi:hypothetical protein
LHPFNIILSLPCGEQTRQNLRRFMEVTEVGCPAGTI